MRRSILAIGTGLVLITAACPDGAALFSDTFAGAALSPTWTVQEGKWGVTDGALVNNGGGLIVLDQSPGARFELEADISFPANWTSLVLYYESPGDYGTLYFGGGYWEYFEMEGGLIASYVQHRDPDITPGVDHHVRVVADCGRITLYYDGKLKGEADLRPRPGARLAFRNLDGGGLLQVKSVRLTKLSTADAKVVRAMQPADLARSVVHADSGLQDAPAAAGRLSGDLTAGAELKYRFAPGDTYEDRFARVPLEAGSCGYVLLDVEGDGSGNKFFIIVHDRSGEQHLVSDFSLSWQGWQECVANLSAFLDSPPGKQRLHTRWGGDENQMIDFPITAVDIGVAKRGARVRSEGRVRFRNVRFVQGTKPQIAQ